MRALDSQRQPRQHLTMKCPPPSTGSFRGPLLAEATVLPVRCPVGCATDSETGVPHGRLGLLLKRGQRRRVIFLQHGATWLETGVARDTGGLGAFTIDDSFVARRPTRRTSYGKLIPSNGVGAVQCFLFDVA